MDREERRRFEVTEDERSTARQEAPLSGTRCYPVPASPERRPSSRVRERQGAPDEVEMGRLVEDAKALAARSALSSKDQPQPLIQRRATLPRKGP
jgi:hypothetical protein